MRYECPVLARNSCTAWTLLTGHEWNFASVGNLAAEADPCLRLSSVIEVGVQHQDLRDAPDGQCVELCHASDRFGGRRVIDYFKTWIPKATAAYEQQLVASRKSAAAEEMARIRRERDKLERVQRVNASLRV